MGKLETTAMEESKEELFATSASDSALVGQVPTGLGAAWPLRARLIGAGQNGLYHATLSNVITQPTPSQTLQLLRFESGQV